MTYPYKVIDSDEPPSYQVRWHVVDEIGVDVHGPFDDSQEAADLCELLNEAYRKGLAQTDLPREPTLGLLMSMAMRLDHALGSPGYYDNQTLRDRFPGGHKRHVEVAIDDMRKVYEEVSGQGFYRPDREDWYLSFFPSQDKQS